MSKRPDFNQRRESGDGEFIGKLNPREDECKDVIDQAIDLLEIEKRFGKHGILIIDGDIADGSLSIRVKR